MKTVSDVAKVVIIPIVLRGFINSYIEQKTLLPRLLCIREIQCKRQKSLVFPSGLFRTWAKEMDGSRDYDSKPGLEDDLKRLSGMNQIIIFHGNEMQDYCLSKFYFAIFYLFYSRIMLIENLMKVIPILFI